MKNRFWLLLIILSFIIGHWSPANAWRITPELAQEVAAKRAAAKANPNDPNARFDLAVTYAYTNNLIDGINTINDIGKIDPAFKEKGLQIYFDKVVADPNDWRLRYRLAFAYYFNDMKTDSIREFKNVLILDPDNVWAYGYLSLLYADLGDIDTAMKMVKKGLSIDSNVAAMHLLLGEGYYKKGDSWAGFRERVEALRLKALGY